MASLYLQRTSKFFWLKFKRTDGGVSRFSTKLDSSNPVDVRRARQLEAEYTLRERSYGPDPDGAGWLWVTQFLNTAYRSSETTRLRFLGAWQNIAMFIEEFEISSPAQFTRKHCFDYMEWRRKPDKPNGKYQVCHNTSLFELKLLRIVLTEAVVRGLCPGNPCVKLKIAKAPPRRCPELTNEQIELIQSKISAVENTELREFLQVTFEIGRWQGCRLGATRLNPKKDVVIHADGTGTIRMVSKGKEFETMLHPRLVPLFERLRRERRGSTWSPPDNAQRTWASLQWTNFLEHSGLKTEIPGVCFRSFRVTVITRMARKNVPISKAKEFVKHASTTVHFAYQRLSPEDLNDCANAIE